LCVTIGRGLPSTTDSCVSTWELHVFRRLIIIEIHSCHIHHHIILLTDVILIIETYITMIDLNRITSKSSLTSFPHFSLSYILWDLIAPNWVLRWIKERICHHHLLLISVRSFPLIGQVENLLLSNSSIRGRSTNSIIIAIFSISLNNFIGVKIILICFIALSLSLSLSLSLTLIRSILTNEIAIVDLLMSR